MSTQMTKQDCHPIITNSIDIVLSIVKKPRIEDTIEEGGEKRNMEQKYKPRDIALAFVATVGFAVAGCDNPVRTHVLDCGKGQRETSVTLQIPDGKSEKIFVERAPFPGWMNITGKDGTISVITNLNDIPVTIGKKKSGEVGIHIPANSADFQAREGSLQIIYKGRGAKNNSSVVEVETDCRSSDQAQ